MQPLPPVPQSSSLPAAKVVPKRAPASALVTNAHGSGAVALAAWAVGGAELAGACVAGALTLAAVVAFAALAAFAAPEPDDGYELEQAARARMPTALTKPKFTVRDAVIFRIEDPPD